MSNPANFGSARPVLNPDDVAMLLIDHQRGLFQTVGDMPLPKLRLRAAALAKMAQAVTLARVVQAGVVPMDTAAVAAELQATWNRDDAMAWAAIYTSIFPAYQLLIESCGRAQEVVTHHEVLDSRR
ncbi:hypothetical protein [Aeromonas molluscorum]|uniref:Isochorismatase hydrolase n=1 Tax=Aeromonas molluscorum 848 TaxID=1268236 RepID=R1GR88_9GAMM|nr:hypothetical protein [Aeromonas molluscorum]EOD54215.1 isochorismatase hydrolase [Aeromonas molluscorum 848]